MLKKVINFLKYNNVTVLMLAFIFWTVIIVIFSITGISYLIGEVGWKKTVAGLNAC